MGGGGYDCRSLKFSMSFYGHKLYVLSKLRNKTINIKTWVAKISIHLFIHNSQHFPEIRNFVLLI